MTTISSKKYRRKPVEIEAIQWQVMTSAADSAKPIVDYINANGGRAKFIYDLDFTGKMVPGIYIFGTDGTLMARPFDFICRGISGEYWPSSPHVFRESCEEITETPVVEDQSQ